MQEAKSCVMAGQIATAMEKRSVKESKSLQISKVWSTIRRSGGGRRPTIDIFPK